MNRGQAREGDEGTREEATLTSQEGMLHLKTGPTRSDGKCQAAMVLLLLLLPPPGDLARKSGGGDGGGGAFI